MIVMVDKVKDGSELLVDKTKLENTIVTNEVTMEAKTRMLNFINDLESFCNDRNIPFQYSHVISNEYFPEFIRTKWETLYLSGNLTFEFTPFGHLINWQEGIEESYEDYWEFIHKGETYWIGV